MEPILVIRNGTLVTGAGRRAADIVIAEGRIAKVAEPGTLADAAETIDAGGLFVLPGVIDGHVHFREPGLTHKEDWLTGSRAAVFGGVTTVLEMPNTEPPTRTAEDARAKATLAAEKSYCDFGLFGLVDSVGAVSGSLADLIGSGTVVGLKVFLAPSTGELEAPPDAELARALELAKRAGLRTAFHAEDALTIRASGGARPIEAEVRAIDHAGGLLSRTGAAGHILHVSSGQGIEAVRRWRSRGVDLTCEVTPHHLFLGDADPASVKVYPPLRGRSDADALLSALADGTIDCVASDHAPHTPDEKAATDPATVPAGVPGVETLLPLLLAAAGGALSLEQVVRATSEGPARTWGLWPTKGSLELGADADLAIVDLGRDGVISGAGLHGRHPLTPYEGRPLHGAVVDTILRGRPVVRDGQLLAEPGSGRWIGDGFKL